MSEVPLQVTERPTSTLTGRASAPRPVPRKRPRGARARAVPAVPGIDASEISTTPQARPERVAPAAAGRAGGDAVALARAAPSRPDAPGEPAAVHVAVRPWLLRARVRGRARHPPWPRRHLRPGRALARRAPRARAPWAGRFARSIRGASAPFPGTAWWAPAAGSRRGPGGGPCSSAAVSGRRRAASAPDGWTSAATGFSRERSGAARHARGAPLAGRPPAAPPREEDRAPCASRAAGSARPCTSARAASSSPPPPTPTTGSARCSCARA